ncbi:short chain fatty acid transporter family protein [Streptococcus pyogenes SS1447]|nr:short chain fatty acid transporter family protein [Streptococcus pyogenes SS1447]
MNNIKTKKRFMDRYIDGFMKWMPESLFICFILTFLVVTMSVLMTDSPFIGTEKTGGIIYGWVNGFWGAVVLCHADDYFTCDRECCSEFSTCS